MTWRSTPQSGVDRMVSTGWNAGRRSSPVARQGRAIARGLEGRPAFQHHHIQRSKQTKTASPASFSLDLDHGIYRDRLHRDIGVIRLSLSGFQAAGSAGGISPPAAHRTVRKPLNLHGSPLPCHLTMTVDAESDRSSRLPGWRPSSLSWVIRFAPRSLQALRHYYL